jgi:hypothetical protein
MNLDFVVIIYFTFFILLLNFGDKIQLIAPYINTIKNSQIWKIIFTCINVIIFGIVMYNYIGTSMTCILIALLIVVFIFSIYFLWSNSTINTVINNLR